jgi:chromosome segregation ATPase
VSARVVAWGLLGLAGVAGAVQAPVADTTARVRTVTAETQKQAATVDSLHKRVDTLEAQSAAARAELAARDKAIADLHEQLRQARAAGATPASTGSAAGPRH